MTKTIRAPDLSHVGEHKLGLHAHCVHSELNSNLCRTPMHVRLVAYWRHAHLDSRLKIGGFCLGGVEASVTTEVAECLARHTGAPRRYL